MIALFSFDPGSCSLAENREQFRGMLWREIDWQLNRQRRNFKAVERYRWLNIGIGLLSSALIGAFGGQEQARYIAILTAAGTFFSTVNRSFSLQARSGWHMDKRLALEALLADFDSGLDLNDARKRRIAIEEDLGKRFPHGETFK